MKLPLAEPEQPLALVQAVIVMVVLGVSVIVMFWTCWVALLVIVPLKSTRIVRGLPLVTSVLQVLVRANVPGTGGAHPFVGGVPLSQEAPLAGPVIVSPSGVVPEAWARLGSVDDMKLVLKLPL